MPRWFGNLFERFGWFRFDEPGFRNIKKKCRNASTRQTEEAMRLENTDLLKNETPKMLKIQCFVDA